jgi:hypothetical protein
MNIFYYEYSNMSRRFLLLWRSFELPDGNVIQYGIFARDTVDRPSRMSAFRRYLLFFQFI